MGDMADMLYEQELNYELTHGMGGEYYIPPQPKTCKYCEEPGLLWGKTGSGWRLFTGAGVLHSCEGRL